MLVFDFVAGVVILAIVLAILLIGIRHSHRLQHRLEAERRARSSARSSHIVPVPATRYSQREIDEPVRPLVRARRDDEAA